MKVVFDVLLFKISQELQCRGKEKSEEEDMHVPIYHVYAQDSGTEGTWWDKEVMARGYATFTKVNFRSAERVKAVRYGKPLRPLKIQLAKFAYYRPADWDACVAVTLVPFSSHSKSFFSPWLLMSRVSRNNHCRFLCLRIRKRYRSLFRTSLNRDMPTSESLEWRAVGERISFCHTGHKKYHLPFFWKLVSSTNFVSLSAIALSTENIMSKPLESRSKNNFRGIDISQTHYKESPSLSPRILLSGMEYVSGICVMFTIVFK